MGLADRARDAVDFGISQITGFMEILKLKLRIIGFADKKSGLFSRLGEMIYKASQNGADPMADERSAYCIEEIKITEHEISTAEDNINKRKAESRLEREKFISGDRVDSGESDV